MCGIGKNLLLAVYQYAIDNKISFWRINSLPFEKLIKYYENFGFKRGKSKFRNGQIKVVEMEMEIYKSNMDNANEFLCISENPDIDDIDIEDISSTDDFVIL